MAFAKDNVDSDNRLFCVGSCLSPHTSLSRSACSRYSPNLQFVASLQSSAMYSANDSPAACESKSVQLLPMASGRNTAEGLLSVLRMTWHLASPGLTAK